MELKADFINSQNCCKLQSRTVMKIYNEKQAKLENMVILNLWLIFNQKVKEIGIRKKKDTTIF